MLKISLLVLSALLVLVGMGFCLGYLWLPFDMFLHSFRMGNAPIPAELTLSILRFERYMNYVGVALIVLGVIALVAGATLKTQKQTTDQRENLN